MAPKMKTHRGAAKRFKRTRSGKFIRRAAGKRHLLEGKAPGRKRRLRTAKTVHPTEQKRVQRMLPHA